MFTPQNDLEMVSKFISSGTSSIDLEAILGGVLLVLIDHAVLSSNP